MDRMKRKLLVTELGKLIDTGITEKDNIKGLEEKGINVSLSKNLTFDTYGSNIITFKSTEVISEQLEADDISYNVNLDSGEIKSQLFLQHMYADEIELTITEHLKIIEMIQIITSVMEIANSRIKDDKNILFKSFKETLEKDSDNTTVSKKENFIIVKQGIYEIIFDEKILSEDFPKLKEYDVKTGDESNQVINNTIANQSGGKIEAGETRNVSGQTVYNYLEQYYLTKDDMSGIKDRIDKNSNRISELDKKIGKAVGKIAGATAMANIPNLQYDQKTAFGAAFGTVDGASAIALGITGQNNRKTIVYKASVSADSKRGFSGGAGLNIGVIK